MEDEAIPSSPPLAALLLPEEVDDAPVDVTSPDGFHRPNLLKRGFSSSSWMAGGGTDEHHPSSDPPTFSSDDGPDASIDDYAAPRKRRQHRGPWWDAAGRRRRGERPRKTKKGGLVRNVDSGVWLPSDGSFESVESGGEGPVGEEEAVVAVDQPDGLGSDEGRAAVNATSSSEAEARRRIALACEEGNERIDLSDLGLEHISDDVLLPLQTLVRQPVAFGHEGLFSPLAPALQLFVSGNCLSRLPPRICNFEDLTVLSLRNNNLAELPPSIGKLRNLVELNVAGNQLRWLPAEMLPLFEPRGKLKNFYQFPNPYLEGIDLYRYENRFQRDGPLGTGVATVLTRLLPIRDRLWAQPPERTDPTASWICRTMRHWRLLMHDLGLSVKQAMSLSAPALLAITPVTKFRVDGTHDPSSPSPLSSLPPDINRVDTTTTISRLEPTSPAVPSLFELALRSFAFSLRPSGTAAPSYLSPPRRRPLAFHLPATSPPQLLAAARAADDVRASPAADSLCSVCGAAFVLPRTEWLEFWGNLPGCLFMPEPSQTLVLGLPFRRRGCSARCGPWVRTEEEWRALAYLAEEWQFENDAEGARVEERGLNGGTE